MVHRTLAVALAVLLLLSGCATPLQSVDSGSTGADATTISVSGTGQVSTEADLALVFVSVSARAETANEARSQVARNASRMRSALRTDGVPDDAVTTTSFRISPRYDRGDGEPVLVGYEAVHAFRIEVAPDRAGTVIDRAVGNGADEVGGVQFTLTDDTRLELRQEALTRAVAAARDDADTTASAANLTITGVRDVSTSGGFTPVFETRVSDAGTTLEPGPVTVEVSVSITYTAD